LARMGIISTVLIFYSSALLSEGLSDDLDDEESSCCT
jgi:hypothetical protein